jgi:uncharacterized protein
MEGSWGEIDREDFRNLLVEIASARMPYGRYGREAHPPHGFPLMDLPDEYLQWFRQRGFPKGRLGELMAELCAIREGGMDSLFDSFRAAAGGRARLRKPRGARDRRFPMGGD